MTELCGTFDAAKADWNKLFGEAPKSIDDIDVIGLHDKTIDKKREFVAIDRVLEIIDKQNALAQRSTLINNASKEYINGLLQVTKDMVLSLQGGQNEKENDD